MNPELRAALAAQIKARAALLAAGAEASDELVKRVQSTDAAVLELLGKEDDSPPAVPQDISKRLKFRDFLTAFAEGKSVTGANKEVCQGLKLDPQTEMPLEALAPTQRAAGDPPLDSDVTSQHQNTDAILARVFENTDADFLGITPTSVGRGRRFYPLITDGGSGSMQSHLASVSAESWAFDVVELKPTRSSIYYKFSLENVAYLGSGIESALRADMRSAIGQLRDTQIIRGSGTAPAVNGLHTRLTKASDPGAVVTGNDIRNALVSLVDSRYVRSTGDIRLLLGHRGFDKARSVFVNTMNEVDGIQAAERLGARVRRSTKLTSVGKRTPADSSQTETAFVDYGIAVANPADLVNPVWQGIRFVRDPFSDAASAQVRLTAHVLWQFGVKRLDSVKSIAVKVV